MEEAGFKLLPATPLARVVAGGSSDPARLSWRCRRVGGEPAVLDAVAVVVERVNAPCRRSSPSRRNTGWRSSRGRRATAARARAGCRATCNRFPRNLPPTSPFRVHEGFDGGDLAFTDPQVQRQHRRGIRFPDRAQKGHVTGLHVGDEHPVGALRRDGSPQSVAQLQLLPVLGEPAFSANGARFGSCASRAFRY